MKPLVQRNIIQRRKIYQSYKNEYFTLKYNKKKNIVASQYVEMINVIINYVIQIETIKNADTYFNSKKERYIKKLRILQKLVDGDKNYFNYLPNVMKAHTSLFRYVKQNKIKCILPENGIDLMMLLISSYG